MPFRTTAWRGSRFTPLGLGCAPGGTSCWSRGWAAGPSPRGGRGTPRTPRAPRSGRSGRRL
eukprot:6789063-Alexandrium_andersonii.AAC.1